MAVLKSKYNLKQSVYSVHVSSEMEQHPCPDCDGSGYWKIEGKDKHIPCDTCNKSWNTGRLGVILKHKKIYIIEYLTIGQIRIQSGYDPEVRYMCEETGLGSGSLWLENTLFPTREEAVKIGEEMLEVYERTGVCPYITDFMNLKHKG